MQKEKSSEEQEYMNDEETAEESEEEEHPSKEEKTEEKERTGEKEKSPLASKVEENKESINIEKEAPTQKELVVPVLELGEVQKTEIERSLNKEIPTIEKEEREISVPIVDLKPPSFTLKRSALNLEIPEIKKEERQLIIPKIQLKPVPSLSLRITELDTRIEKPQVSLKLPKVPSYRTEKYELKSSLTSFDTTINEELKLLLLEGPEEDWVSPESAEKETVEQWVTTVAAEPEAPSGSGEEEEDIPDVLDLISGGSVGRIAGKGAKIILLKNRQLENKEDDTSTEFLKKVCARIYREHVGGEPKFEVINKIEDLPDNLNSYSDPRDKLFHIDLDTIEEKDIDTEDKDSYKRLQRCLEKVPFADHGFILFTTRDESIFSTCSSTLDKINADLKDSLRQNIIKLKFRKLSPHSKCSIASLCWGMVDLSEGEEGALLDFSFDIVFNSAKYKFGKKLEDVKKEEKGLFERATKRPKARGDKESDLHYAIKVFLVRYLTHKLRERKKEPLDSSIAIKESIKIEKELEIDSEIAPDIKLDDEVYEVETLFGEGYEGIKKIDETIEKYAEHPEIKVNIVMDNFGFLLHLRDLSEIKRDYYRGKNEGHHEYPDVEFYTLDVQNGEIVKLSDVIQSLKKIREEISGGYA